MTSKTQERESFGVRSSDCQRRWSIRHAMHAPAVLCSAKDAAIRVTLIDASDEGARIQTEAEGKVDALCFYRLYVPNLFESECLCVWHQQSQAGLSFLQPLPPGVVDDLAQIFPALPENAAVSGPPSRTRFRAV